MPAERLGLAVDVREYEARELAITRMEEEAEQLGADGVWGAQTPIGRGGEPRRSLLATPSCGSAS